MDSLRLIPSDGSDPIVVDRDLVLIGRDAICDIRLKDVSVSRQHAEIRWEDGRWLVRDLNSANGILIDDARIPKSMLLNGQHLQFGTVGYVVETAQGADEAAATRLLDRPDLGAKPPARRAPRSARHDPIPAPASKPKSSTSRALLLALAGVVIGTLVTLLWLRASSPARPRKSAAARTATSPTSTAPPSEGARPSAPGVTNQAVIVLSTDSDAVVFLDGESKGTLAKGQVRREEVAPGEHLVTFKAEGESQDFVVRAGANEQAVARFVARPSPRAKPADTPARAASRPAAREPVAAPRPAPPTPAPPARVSRPRVAIPPAPVPTRPPAPPLITDEELARGAAATSRGDFYRALLLLNNAARRLEKDPQAGDQSALTQAYLAWTYQGLERAGEARQAADKAVRIKPDIADTLGTFPASVLDLFKRPR